MSELDLLADCLKDVTKERDELVAAVEQKDEMIRSMESVLAKIATRLNVPAGDVPSLLEAIGQLDVPLTYEQMDAAMRKVGELTTALEQYRSDLAERDKVARDRLKRIEQLEAALRDVFILIDEGKMVKKVTRDECPTFVQRLRKIKDTLETVEDS